VHEGRQEGQGGEEAGRRAEVLHEALRQEARGEEEVVRGEEAVGREEVLVAPARPRIAQLATIAALAAAFVAVLVAVTSAGGILGLDHDVAASVARHREPWLTSAFKVLTWLGSSTVLVPVALAGGGWLRRKGGSWRPMLVLALTLAGAFGFSQLVKHAVGRARPDDRLVHAVGYAFPSGHATFAAAGWPALALLLAAAWPARRRALVAAALVVTAIVGASRVYLQVHWTTDVLGGWLLGALWLAIVLAAAARRRPPSGS
jgi:membrane-associated phospholipid phosphatase